MAKVTRYLVDGNWPSRSERYVRAWKEGRRNIVVQVWNSGEPIGEPDGDWEMPAILGAAACIDQAVRQTPMSEPKL